MPEQRKRDLDDAEIVWVYCVGGGVGIGRICHLGTELCDDGEKSCNGRRE